MNALAEIRQAPGLDSYLEQLEARLREAVAAYPGVVSAAGEGALAAGGKRLRPLLVFLSAPAGQEPDVAAGVAVELVHMATLAPRRPDRRRGVQARPHRGLAGVRARGRPRRPATTSSPAPSPS